MNTILNDSLNASWMAATLAATLLIALAARTLEKVVALRRGAAIRWVWVSGIVLAFGYAGRWLLPRSELLSAAPVFVAPAMTVSRAVAARAIAGSTGDAFARVSRSSRSGWHSIDDFARLPALGATTERRLQFVWIALSSLLALVIISASVRLALHRRSWLTMRVAGHTVQVSPDFGPAIVGVLHSTIVVPAWVLALDVVAQRAILSHEDEHRRAGDPRLLALALGALVVMPWNPGLWYMWRRLIRAVELDCDERVLARGVSVAEYATVLLDAWQHAHRKNPWIPSPAFAEHASGLGQRVQHLLRPLPRRRFMRSMQGSIISASLIGATLLVPTPERAHGATRPQAMVSSTPSVRNDATNRAAASQPAMPIRPSRAIRVTASRPPTPPMHPSAEPPVVALQPVDVTSGTPTAAISATIPTISATARAQSATRLLLLAPYRSLEGRAEQVVREQLQRDTAGRPLYIIPRSETASYLTASGFYEDPRDLRPDDVLALGQLVRASLLVKLSVAETLTGSRLLASIVNPATREVRTVDLGSFSTPERMGDAVSQAIRADTAYQRLRRP